MPRGAGAHGAGRQLQPRALPACQAGGRGRPGQVVAGACPQPVRGARGARGGALLAGMAAGALEARHLLHRRLGGQGLGRPHAPPRGPCGRGPGLGQQLECPVAAEGRGRAGGRPAVAAANREPRRAAGRGAAPAADRAGGRRHHRRLERQRL
eukprot:6606449-Lingulodinium_polyedra.AAC.1